MVDNYLETIYLILALNSTNKTNKIRLVVNKKNKYTLIPKTINLKEGPFLLYLLFINLCILYNCLAVLFTNSSLSSHLNF